MTESVTISYTPRISVLICTYNGEASIGALLQSLMEQNVPEGAAYEAVVVDNNSCDGTLAVCQRFAAQNLSRIQVLTESQQGKSYALNRGLDSLRGEICCVVDQDELLPADYLEGVWKAFLREPSVSFIGGRVLPLPQQQFPDWITAEHWAPLAICDYGAAPFTVDSQRFVCLITGAFRTADLRAVGGYRGPLGIEPGRLGSLEDADVYERLINAGKTGRYIPDIVMYHRLSEERLCRDYHRRWHFGHGRYFSDLRSPAFESLSWRVLGVPGHVFRQAAWDLWKMILHAVRGAWEQAFVHEQRLRFFLGYVLRRWRLG